jgi:hypothetical protein
MFLAALGLGILLGVFRIVGLKSQTFQAAAHLYMGAIVTLAFLVEPWGYGSLAVVLSIVEVTMFVIQRRK